MRKKTKYPDVKQNGSTHPFAGLHLALPLLVCLLGILSIHSLKANQAAIPSEFDRQFALKVFPLLKEKCFACHGDDRDKIKGELILTSREDMLKGGEYSSKVLVPGHADESELYISVTWKNPDLEMPPKENDRLDENQIALLREWINNGAQWPDESTQKAIREEQWTAPKNEDGILVKTSGGQADTWTYRRYNPEDVWAFQPVIKPEMQAEILRHCVLRQ